MPTSGDYNYNLTRNQIIEDAAELAGIFDPEGQSLTASQYTRYSRSLNNIISSWQVDGLIIWTRKIGAVFLQKGQSEYVIALDKTNSDHSTLTPITTRLSSGSGTSILVTSTEDMTAGDNIGIEMSTGYMHWTTIVSVDSTTALTLTTGGSSYLTGGVVWVYTTKLSKAIRIKDGYVRQSAGGNDTPIKVLSEEEYMRFGVKTTPGLTTQVWYQPQVPNGTFHCYPVPTTSNTILFVELQYPFQHFNGATDNPDFPAAWLQALIYALATEIAWKTGMEEKRLNMLQQKADFFHQYALGDSQEESVFLQPDRTTHANNR